LYAKIRSNSFGDGTYQQFADTVSVRLDCEGPERKSWQLLELMKQGLPLLWLEQGAILNGQRTRGQIVDAISIRERLRRWKTERFLAIGKAIY